MSQLASSPSSSSQSTFLGASSAFHAVNRLQRRRELVPKFLAVFALLGVVSQALSAEEGTKPAKMLSGAAAFGDWREDAPGVCRHITANDLPKPFATPSAAKYPQIIARPPGALPKVPKGFDVALFATGLKGPRLLRVAPNGDIFVAEMLANRVRVLRAGPDGASPSTIAPFAQHLSLPFGISFYPPGPEPQWIYVANTDSVVRFPYRNGDLKARGAPETIVAELPVGGHATRDVAFSPDGKRMFVSVGSASNAGEGLPPKKAEAAAQWDRDHGAIGAGWGDETWRADVLVFTPEGKDRRVFATGIRNCVGLAVHPTTGDVWCSTNERDELGDDLVPDYVTRVREGGFYGWPWYYISDHEDPRLKGQRPDLKGKAIVPDTLLQAHSASLQMSFYDGSAFPPAYRGTAFVAEHGSWNRSKRTGYKVIRVPMKDGVPTGEYEDFMTGFVIDDAHVWGRPVGVAIAKDGSLLVSEDGNGTIWRVTYHGER
jgi:glucose/arabinose dehydrogenase